MLFTSCHTAFDSDLTSFWSHTRHHTERVLVILVVMVTTCVTDYGKTNHSRHFVETEINTPSERTFIADQNGAFIFSIGLSCAKL